MLQDIIHIGYPKTGTTWLQNEFFPYVKNRYIVPRGLIKELIYGKNIFDYSRDKVLSKIKSPCLMSFEGFSGNIHNYGLNGLMIKEYACRLHELFPDAVVILFLRNQYDAIISSYLQYIKNGGTYGIKRYLFHDEFKDPKDGYLFSFDYFKFDNVIELYQNLFGEENVKVYLYEEFESSKELFLKRFMDELELEIDLASVNLQRVNYSYRNFVTIIARIFNIFSREGMIYKYYLMHIPGWHVFSKKMLYKLNQMFGYKHVNPEQILGKRVLSYIGNYYAESNRKLLDKFHLIEIEKYNYPLK